MKFTLIAEDNTICVDGISIRGVDLTNLPKGLWAIQWDDATNSGEIEWEDDREHTPLTSKTQEFSPGRTIQYFAELHAEEWAVIQQEELDAIPTAMEHFRYLRNKLLTESDWTQVSDNALSDEDRAQWAAYRQLLRNITETQTPSYNDEYELLGVTWPEPPRTS